MKLSQQKSLQFLFLYKVFIFMAYSLSQLRVSKSLNLAHFTVCAVIFF